MAVTLIDPFEVAEGSEQDPLKEWDAAAEHGVAAGPTTDPRRQP